MGDAINTAVTAGEYLFHCHGLDLRLRTSVPAFVEPACTFLHHFQTDVAQGAPVLTIQFDEVAGRAEVPVKVSVGSKVLFSGERPSLGDAVRSLWQCEIVQDGDRLIADFHEQGVLVIDGARNLVEGYFIRPDAMHPDVRTSFLHFALAELLKRNGLFTVHATALEYAGQGVLIPGYSGQGKTTSFLSLLRSGFRYLSDDYPLLRDQGTHMELLAFPMKIDVTDRTIEFFPELRNAPPGLLKQGIQKKHFQSEDLYAESIGRSCTPALIMFSHVVDMPHSCLEPLTKRRTLEALLPQGLLVYDQTVARRNSRRC